MGGSDVKFKNVLGLETLGRRKESGCRVDDSMPTHSSRDEDQPRLKGPECRQVR